MLNYLRGKIRAREDYRKFVFPSPASERNVNKGANNTKLVDTRFL